MNSFLNNAGNHVVLFDPKGNIVDQYEYSQQESGVSIGRDPDGTGSFKSCTTASKGTSNNNLCP
jgi:hypothetical protein